jgi:hypothetical protein
VKSKTNERVTLDELKQMISGTAVIESKAKHAVDLGLSSQVGVRGSVVFAVVVFPAMVLGGLYAMFRAPQQLEVAIPRRSFLMRALIDRDAPERAQELAAMRYRKLLRVANRQVVSMGGFGVAMLGLYAYGGLGKKDMEENLQSDINRDCVAYQHHTESALKYLWFVYFHHPAYMDKAKGSRLSWGT